MTPKRLRELRRQGIELPGGIHARITTFWYDEEDWVIRYLTTTTDAGSCVIPVPILDADEPYRPRVGDDAVQLFYLEEQAGPVLDDDLVHGTEMSRADECTILRWYGLPPYWGGAGVWGNSLRPEAFISEDTKVPANARYEEPGRAAIRAADDVLHDTVACPDGAYGWVEDHLVDLTSWEIHYLIVRILPGYLSMARETSATDALISPFWGRWTREADQVRVPFTRATILAGPAYDPEELSSQDEQVLARYYGFATNWTSNHLSNRTEK